MGVEIIPQRYYVICDVPECVSCGGDRSVRRQAEIAAACIGFEKQSDGRWFCGRHAPTPATTSTEPK